MFLFLLMVGGVVQAQPLSLEDMVQEASGNEPYAVGVEVTTPDDVWQVTHGMADADRPTVPADRFRIGSMSKTFVSVTTLMLVDDGVLSLDAAASTWLSSEIVDSIPNADVVTIRQLLGMRSGIPDYVASPSFFQAVLADLMHPWTLDEALSHTYGASASAAPGEEYTYSNTNYLLLQLILEEATGLPLSAVIRDRILESEDLTNTYTQISEDLPGGFVQGFLDIDFDGGFVIGYASFGVYLPRHDAVIMILSARDVFSPEMLALEIAQALFG
jgi:D-alanyl-D-alanine carboxypeptidase